MIFMLDVGWLMDVHYSMSAVILTVCLSVSLFVRFRIDSKATKPPNQQLPHSTQRMNETETV